MMNKKLISIICCATGAAMLAAGAAASYRTANGYEALKKSILSTRDLTNCTVSAGMRITAEGNELADMQLLSELDAENKREHDMYTTKTFGVGATTDVYTCDDLNYYRSIGGDTGSDAYIKSSFSYMPVRDTLWGIPENEPDTVNTFDKALRFMELAADTVVGDLRNNFVCTDDSGYYTSYTVSLSSVQIPELINAGLGVLFTMSNNDADHMTYKDDNGNTHKMSDNPERIEYYTMLLGDDPVVDNITLDYTVDKSGLLHDGKATVIFTGNGHEIRFDITAALDKVGTTEILTPEEQGAEVIDSNRVKP